MSDIIQRTILDVQATGADSVTILAQAAQEAQARFQALWATFREDSNATKLIAGLRGVAASLAEISKIANTDADAMRKAQEAMDKAAEAADKLADRRTRAADRAADAQVKDAERAAAASAAFVDKANADLLKRDAEEAKLDAQSKARTDAKIARDQATLDAIGAAADRAAKAALKAADDMAAADARKDAANAKVLADAEGWEAMQARLGAMEKRTSAESKDAIDKTTAARQHGTQAVADFIVKTREHGQAAQQAAQVAIKADNDEFDALEKLNLGMKANAATMNKQIDAFLDMEASMQGVTTKVAAGKGQFGGFATAVDQAADKTKRMGYNMMSVAYAMDDVRYGIGSVINNVPMLAQAFGASQTWAAWISIAAIGVYELGKAMTPVATQFAREWGLLNDDAKMFVDSIDQMKLKIEALKDKPHKVDLDYSNIIAAEKLLEVMQERLNAFNAGRKGNLTEEMAKEAKEATHTFGGGTAEVNATLKAFMEKRGINAASPKDIEDLAMEERVFQQEKEAGTQDPMQIQVSLDEMARLREKIRLANEAFRKQEIGAFELGDPTAIRAMQARAKAEPELFNRAGPGGMTFGEAVANVPATPTEMLRRIEEKEDEKLRDEHEKDTTKQFKERRQKEKQKNAEVRQAEEEAWQVAMGVQREEKTEQDKEKTARDKEVRETSRQMDSGVMPGLEATTRGDFARGATADQSFARTLPRLTQHMKDQGVDDAIAEDVAKDILKKVMDKVGGKVQAAGIAGGIGRQQAGQRVANEAILKLEQQQMNQDKAHLRTLAIGMHGTQIGDEAAARLRQINAMQNNIIHVQTRQRRAVRHSQIKPK